MKIYHYILLFSCLALMSNRCATESEENQFYKNERLNSNRFDETTPISKEAAIEDWEQFLGDSQDVISYTRNNLDAFHYKIDDANGAQKLELIKQYDTYKKDIEKLELKRKSRNVDFNAELSKYDQDVFKRNNALIKQFKRESIRINIALGFKID